MSEGMDGRMDQWMVYGCGLSAGIRSAGDSVPETLGSNPTFSRRRQLLSFPVDITSLFPIASASKSTPTNMQVCWCMYTCRGVSQLLARQTHSGSWLTHWGRVTHIRVGKQTSIGSDNGLAPGRRQAIIWTNAGILLIGLLGTNFSEISIKILTFSFTKMRLNVSSAKWRPFCLGLNVLSHGGWVNSPSYSSE